MHLTAHDGIMLTDCSLNEHQQTSMSTMPLTFHGDVQAAVDEALAWSSMFDHHPTLEELRRDLRHPCSEEAMIHHLEQRHDLVVEAGHVHLLDSERNPHEQQRRRLAEDHLEVTSEVLGILASCSAVTGLAVTGSVAAGKNDENGDVDVLIVTKPGWVWRVRALALFLAHRHPRGQRLCPNMVLAEGSLSIEPSLYGARELMRMIPLKDTSGLSQLHAANAWARNVLPNASMKPLRSVPLISNYPWWWRIMTLPLVGRVVERWEASRRIKQLTSTTSTTEAVYSRSVCRGHENAHKQRIETRYRHLGGEV